MVIKMNIVSVSAVFIVFGCLFSNIYALNDNNENNKVDVTVYYESMCPDSIKFFTQQLYPLLQSDDLANYVNLTLLPYGKSTTTVDKDQFLFKCHHGPAECRGNKIHACAIRLIEEGKKSDDLGFNKVTVGFINCLMGTLKREGDKTQFPTRECGALNKVQNLESIENCAEQTIGSQYLNEVGAKTSEFSSPLKSVPTIVFNNNYKKEDSQLATTDFVKVLCQYIDGEKPKKCNV